MDSKEDFIDRVLRDIAAMEPERQHEASLVLLACVLKVMDVGQIKLMRAEIARDHPCPELLTLIDGHMALRDIQQDRKPSE